MLFRSEYTFQDPTAEGRRSPDFSASDINGKPFSLKDFRGKYLYIDMWATWCSPCKAELPYLMELEKKFEGKNIHFLGLSIDKDSIAWANKVSSETLPSQQLYLGTGSKFQEIYEINTVPRFILLDKEGNIVNASMMRPSTENIDKLLNQLDGI